MRIIKKAIEFEWDEGNIAKNRMHEVTDKESEEPFFDKKRFIFKDHIHSKHEERLRLLGKTRKGRLLFVVFTKRRGRIRIISARDINRKEVYLYEKKTRTPKIQK